MHPSICPSIWICEIYVVHHLTSKGLRCAPSTCAVHHGVQGGPVCPREVGVANIFHFLMGQKEHAKYGHLLSVHVKLKEDRVYFWRKAGKTLKKFRKTGKNTKNMAGNRKMPFWIRRKLTKNLRKAGKSIFFLRKAGKRPPGPLITIHVNI